MSVIDDTEKMRFLYSRRSSSGFVVRSSCHTKTIRTRTPATIGPMIFASPKPPAEPDSARP
jgi:hypothetical protein